MYANKFKKKTITPGFSSVLRQENGRYYGQHLCLELGCVPDVTLAEDRSGQSCQGQGQETRGHHPGLLAAGDTLALPASREHLATDNEYTSIEWKNCKKCQVIL